MTNQYKEDSIQKLDPLSFTRLRPDTYCGSTEDSTQLVVELITNCKDEFLIGNCDEVHITINEKENIITVADSGQGIIPSLIKEEGKTVLEMVYGDINTSGKYDKSEDAVYKESTGAFGIGASLSNFLSHWLTATTKRDGKFETIYFIEGKFDHREEGVCPKHEHGVTVSLNPSEEFFKNAKPNIKTLQRMLYNDSCVCPGLKYYLNDEEFYHPEGLKDLILVEKETALTNIFNLNQEEGRQKLNLVLVYTPQSKVDIIPFCNYALIEAGTPITTIKSTLTRTLNKWAKEQGLLKEKDKNLEGTALQEGLKLAFNLSSPNIRYDSQTKVRVTSTEDNTFLSSSLSSALEIWLDNNPSDGQIIIERALVARKAAEAAKKARERVKTNATKTVANKVKILHPDKLKDAEYLGEESTLLIVEGLSAGASMAVARDREHYGILMLRGKLINAFANKEEKLNKNEEIQLLLKALNVNPYNYDSSKLRYGKVAICVDSDSDGYHIGLLIMVALQHFCPQFIQEGRLCWLRSPLYIVKNKGKENYYFTDEEIDAVRGTISGEIQRNKGLGSLSADQAKASMFGENQKMDVLLPSEEALQLLSDLMGSTGAARKEFVFNKIDFSEVRE